LQLQIVAHNTHCTQQNNHTVFTEQNSSISKSWVLKLRYKISGKIR